jgi:hypothetical protein
MNRSTPNELEASALRKIVGLRSSILAMAGLGATATVASRLIPNMAIQIAVTLCAALAVIGAGVYLSFGLRCPRCSSWIPVAFTAESKCTSCGMRLQPPDALNHKPQP